MKEGNKKRGKLNWKRELIYILIVIGCLSLLFVFLYNFRFIFLENFNGLVKTSGSAIYNEEINLTQTEEIEDASLSYYNNYRKEINLGDYFDDLAPGNENLQFGHTLSPGASAPQIVQDSDFTNNRRIIISKNPSQQESFNINLTLGYPGLDNVTTNNFQIHLLLYCEDSDSLNYSVVGTTVNSSGPVKDYCVNGSYVREYLCNNSQIRYQDSLCEGYCYLGRCFSENHLPVFLEEDCSDLIIRMNEVYYLDMTECFEEADENILVYNYSLTNKNLTIKREGKTILVITPKKDWEGKGYFFVYGKDPVNETRGEVGFRVVNFSSSSSSPNKSAIDENSSIPPETADLSIVAYPDLSEVTILDSEIQEFSVTNKDYSGIIWYLNGEIISEGESYTTSGLEEGNYSLSVQVIKEDYEEQKEWRLIIEKEEPDRDFVWDVGSVVFYLVVAILMIVIFMIVWIIIKEKRKREGQTESIAGFGISSEPALKFNSEAQRE